MKFDARYVGFLRLSEEAQFSQSWLLLGFFEHPGFQQIYCFADNLNLKVSMPHYKEKWGPGGRQISDTNMHIKAKNSIGKCTHFITSVELACALILERNVRTFL